MGHYVFVVKLHDLETVVMIPVTYTPVCIMPPTRLQLSQHVLTCDGGYDAHKHAPGRMSHVLFVSDVMVTFVACLSHCAVVCT